MAQNTSNYPQDVPIVQRIPTRLVPSGTLSVNAGATVTFPGTNNRQDRVQIVITNQDGAQNLYLQTPNGVPWATIFPQSVETFDTSADIVIFNPGANPVSFQVGEFYPDTGASTAFKSLSFSPRGGSNPSAPSGGGSPGGGGTPSGGGSFSGAGSGGTPSGGSRQGFTP